MPSGLRRKRSAKRFVEYSIVIPAFNKADLTRTCLRSLDATLGDKSRGEVIVIDNASSDRTPQMLQEFPWVTVVRNDRNTGFGAANNQGARMARGEFLIMLNNDIEAKAGWLDAMLETARSSTGIGAVGAKLLYANGTIQHAGVVVYPERFHKAAFTPVHAFTGYAQNAKEVMRRRDFQMLTAACLLTPRAVFLELGGLDEQFWNGYEDVDYCLRLRSQGLRLVYEPSAVLTHFESQSGPQRFRKVAWNMALLAKRWNAGVTLDRSRTLVESGVTVRDVRLAHGARQREHVATPQTTIVVHGAVNAKAQFEKMLRSEVHAPIAAVHFVDDEQAVQFVRMLMEHRGDRYLALVDAQATLEAGWLDELAAQVEFSPNTGAAAYAPEAEAGENVSLAAADARCTLLHLEKFPQHERLADLPTLNEAVTDLLFRATAFRTATRGVSRAIGTLPPANERVRAALTTDRAVIEQQLRAMPGRRPGLVSIVMLSWNAPQFTKLALESIREHTRGEYEVIIVDNGSRSETVDWLKTLADQPDVRVIFNPTNRGYAGGNNQAIAAARGEYIVLLNNDVIVTDGWLDGLLHAFDRIPALGVSAPRSNKIAGDQIVVDASYDGIEAMHRFAAGRSERYRDQGYITDRAIGLCLCIDRRLIEEIGGIDERFGIGNFEDDDFCMRVRASGYRIFVCNDVFIHHFGSQTFAANKVDWTATMRENWTKFAAKWDLPAEQVNGGYVPGPAIRRGFIRERHYVPLPAAQTPPPSGSGKTYRVAFTATVENEDDWRTVSAFVRRYLRAYDASSPSLLAIAALAQPDAQTLGARIERLARKEQIDLDAAADIDVGDEDDVTRWQSSLPASERLDISAIGDPTPSGLRRMLEGVAR